MCQLQFFVFLLCLVETPGATDRSAYPVLRLRCDVLGQVYAELHGLPPILVEVGGGERLLDQQLLVAEQIAKHGASHMRRLAPVPPA